MNKLAINGGPPVRTGPYPKWPAARADEYRRLLEVSETGGREESDLLGEEFADYAGVRYALPVSSGTTALEIIFRALNIGRGDEVILPIYTFVASASSIIYTGATPVFADVLYGSHQLDPASFEKNVSPKTKAVLAVHVGGRPCDMDAVREIAERRRIFVIEDAAQAHGASWRGKKVGSLGTAAAFSFQATKNLPCGEGGLIAVNDEALFRRMKKLREYGGSMGAGQAAVLRERLKDADALFEKRSASAEKLTAALKEFPFIETLEEDSRVTGNAYHLFMFRYDSEKFYGTTREELIELLTAEGVGDCLSSGYSLPITEMDVVRGPDFKRATGSDRDYRKAEIPTGKTLAYEKGAWLYQAALLEDEAGLLTFPAALKKLTQNKEEVLEYIKRRRARG